jgi:hypothetical protein
MGRFSPEQIAAIRRESERLLRDDKPAPRPEPAPTPREARLPEIDAVQEWRDWHEARDQEREDERAEMRREQRDAERERAAGWAAYVDSRIAAALAERQHELIALARGTLEFSNAVTARLQKMEQLIDKLDAAHAKLRAHEDLRRGEIIDLPSPLVRKEHMN